MNNDAEKSIVGKELVEHLSKEILAHFQHAMEFRTKIAFIAWVGPFIIAGSYLVATKDVPRSFNQDYWGLAFLGGAGCLYVLLGVVLAQVESHIWNKCNEWRRLIKEVSLNPSPTISDESVLFAHRLGLAYFVVALLILAIFCLVIAGGWKITHK